MRSEVVIESSESEEIPIVKGVRVDGEIKSPNLMKELTDKKDAFDGNADEIRKMAGLTPGLKRKLARSLVKVGNTDSAHDAGSKAVDPIYSYTSGYSIFDVVLPPYNLDYLAKLYEISAPHYAAVNAKTANIVGLGYTWINSPKTQNVLDSTMEDENKLDKVRKKIQRYKQAMDEWIDTTNTQDIFLEVLKKVWIDYESTGNGYIEIGRTTEGNIGYIGHIPSVTMRIRVQRDGYVQIVGRVATYFRNFGDVKTSNPVGNDPNPNEIIHIKNYTPGNTYYGIPDIISAKNSLAGAEYADRYNLDYFEYKAVPRYVIILKGAKLSAEAESQMLSFFRTGLKGKNHRTLYLPLPKDENVTFEMKAVEAGSQDASFTNYRKQTIDDILMAHRVPITKISIGDATVAGTADADKTFKEQVCQPAQNILEKKINKIIITKTDALLLSLNELTLTDANTQSQMDQRYVMSQIKTPNEIREPLGLPGLPGGDQVIVTSLDQVNVNQKPTKTKKPPVNGVAPAGAPRSATTQQAIGRSNNQSDKQAVGRNPKGTGRKAP